MSETDRQANKQASKQPNRPDREMFSLWHWISGITNQYRESCHSIGNHNGDEMRCDRLHGSQARILLTYSRLRGRCCVICFALPCFVFTLRFLSFLTPRPCTHETLFVEEDSELFPTTYAMIVNGLIGARTNERTNKLEPWGVSCITDTCSGQRAEPCM